MPKSLVTVVILLLAPLGAQALEVLSVSRAVRLVDPGNNVFVDQRSSSLGNFEVQKVFTGRGYARQTSNLVATPPRSRCSRRAMNSKSRR